MPTPNKKRVPNVRKMASTIRRSTGKRKKTGGKDISATGKPKRRTSGTGTSPNHSRRKSGRPIESSRSGTADLRVTGSTKTKKTIKRKEVTNGKQVVKTTGKTVKIRKAKKSVRHKTGRTTRNGSTKTRNRNGARSTSTLPRSHSKRSGKGRTSTSRTKNRKKVKVILHKNRQLRCDGCGKHTPKRDRILSFLDDTVNGDKLCGKCRRRWYVGVVEPSAGGKPGTHDAKTKSTILKRSREEKLNKLFGRILIPKHEEVTIKGQIWEVFGTDYHVDPEREVNDPIKGVEVSIGKIAAESEQDAVWQARQKWRDRCDRTPPVRAERVKKDGRRTQHYTKSFPGYLIMHMEYTPLVKTMLQDIKHLWGLLPIGIPGESVPPPTAMKTQEAAILLIQEREQKDGPKPIEHDFAVDDIVRVIDGPYRKLSGPILSVDERDKACPIFKVEVRIMCMPVPIELKYDQITKEDQ